MITDIKAGRRVEIVGEGCDAGKIGTVSSVVDHGASDSRDWRLSVGVDFDGGGSNLFTEERIQVLR
ncbi:hypothetical protein [Sorangium sp. So ce233]|uniref:hypothetical protein n=1 Tax=Sorangium sp. So ce233 TaxID=3133290 RepID=UPI003F610A5D